MTIKDYKDIEAKINENFNQEINNLQIKATAAINNILKKDYKVEATLNFKNPDSWHRNLYLEEAKISIYEGNNIIEDFYDFEYDQFGLYKRVEDFNTAEALTSIIFEHSNLFKYYKNRLHAYKASRIFNYNEKVKEDLSKACDKVDNDIKILKIKRNSLSGSIELSLRENGTFDPFTFDDIIKENEDIKKYDDKINFLYFLKNLIRNNEVYCRNINNNIYDGTHYSASTSRGNSIYVPEYDSITTFYREGYNKKTNFWKLYKDIEDDKRMNIINRRELKEAVNNHPEYEYIYKIIENASIDYNIEKV